jgi:hypothetical protein
MSNKRYKTLGQAGRDVDALALRVETLEDAPSGGGSEYAETIVNISSAQILSMGTSPIELLPAAGVGKYYDIDKVVMELTAGTQYTSNGATALLLKQGQVLAMIPSDIILDRFDVATIVNTNNAKIENVATVDYNRTPLLSVNQNVVLDLASSATISDGDGTLRVKIYHKTITFGA